MKLLIDNFIIYDDLGYRKWKRIYKFFCYGKCDVLLDEFDNCYYINGYFVVKEMMVYWWVYWWMGYKF